MPIRIYADDIIYIGSQEDFRNLAYFATYCAVRWLGLNCEILSDTRDSSLLYFFPVNPTYQQLEDFLYIYSLAFHYFSVIFENSDSDWFGLVRAALVDRLFVCYLCVT